MGYKHNKEDIVNIGSELFRKQGYNNVGINDILKSSGIPKGSFYNFFESKEDFAAQVLEKYGEGSISLVQEALGKKNLSPINRIKGFYTRVIEDNIKDGCSNGCLLGNVSIELGGINDRLSKIANEKFKALIHLLTETIKEGQDAGEITTSQSAAELAEYLHSGFFGALSRMKVNRNSVFLHQWYKLTFDLIAT